VNPTQSAILRAIELARVLDVEHTGLELHAAFRAVRHELETLRGIHCPQATPAAPELASAHTGRRTSPGSLRHKILGVLSTCPQADFMVANHLRVDVQQIRRRRHELQAAGWVQVTSSSDEPVVKIVQAATGRECTVYQLATAGFAALARLRSGQEVLFSDADLGNDSDTEPDTAKGCDVRPT
jgi:hypothetical protein